MEGEETSLSYFIIGRTWRYDPFSCRSSRDTHFLFIYFLTCTELRTKIEICGLRVDMRIDMSLMILVILPYIVLFSYKPMECRRGSYSEGSVMDSLRFYISLLYLYLSRYPDSVALRKIENSQDHSWFRVFALLFLVDRICRVVTYYVFIHSINQSVTFYAL